MPRQKHISRPHLSQPACSNFPDSEEILCISFYMWRKNNAGLQVEEGLPEVEGYHSVV